MHGALPWDESGARQELMAQDAGQSALGDPA